MQNNFEKYLNLVMEGNEVLVTKNGREVGRFVPKELSCLHQHGHVGGGVAAGFVKILDGFLFRPFVVNPTTQQNHTNIQ
ncbi:MAG: type II toxin-antitoxin system prevent-host-death family antitoxin [Firmicutes bacterium]|nr:type II toxin-antitoxin system prevent-host-death family antitoxin [Bacillota bacterium]